MVASLPPGAHPRFDVVAHSGYGKTLLLNEVAAVLRSRNYLTLFITAQGSDYGDSTRLGRLVADQANCRRLIGAMADDVARAYERTGADHPLLDRAYGRRLEERILASRMSHQQAPIHVTTQVDLKVDHSRDVAITDSARTVVHLGFPDEQRIRANLDAMLLALTSALRDAARRHPLAVLVDDLQTVMSTDTGNWLLAVLTELHPHVVVHARRPVPGHRITAPGLRTITLGNMTEDETTAHVVRALRSAGWAGPSSAECARTVFQATRGHPIGVVTCAHIIARGSVPPDAPAPLVRRQILGGDQHWGYSGAVSSIREFVDRTAGDLVGRPFRVFDQLVVMRRCTPAVLGAVLASQGLDEHQAAILYDWLSGLSFVTPFDDDADQGWRLHDYIRENAERELRTSRPAHHELLHRPVEEYYRRILNFDAELDEESAHTAGHRYENPDWQRDSQEWLHHAAHIGREGFRATRHALIRLFLDAFWWWDAEVPSNYCPQLISSYRSLPAHLDLEWVNWLEQFLTGYVPSTSCAFGAHRQQWARAEDALARLFNGLGLRKGRIPEDRDLRRVYLLVCCLRGDTSWFSSDGSHEDRETATRWLRLSAAACTEPEDHWIATWTIWMESELWVEADPARAEELLAGIEERIDEDGDNELRAFVTQTLADLAWVRGRRSLAFDIDARAVLHMWVYNVRQETAQQTPNAYTLLQYRKVRDTAQQRYQKALDLHLNDVVEAAQCRTRAYFAPYWRHVGRIPDHPAGFPSEPRPEELGRLETAFAGDVLWVIDHMEEQLNAPLGAPLALAPLPDGEGPAPGSTRPHG